MTTTTTRDARPRYAKMDSDFQRHHARFNRYATAGGLVCQECSGSGGYFDYYRIEPPDECGWCEGTGFTTRWLRGAWLRMKRDEKLQHTTRRAAGACGAAREAACTCR